MTPINYLIRVNLESNLNETFFVSSLCVACVLFVCSLCVYKHASYTRVTYK